MNDRPESDEAHSGAEMKDPATGEARAIVPGVPHPSGLNAASATKRKRDPLSAEVIAQGVLDGDRTMLGRAITLVESSNADHQRRAREVLQRVLPQTGRSIRIGISGVPGVGKSTFIEAFGSLLTAAGHRVAVLAIDPSSQISRGSILGDKTRMEQLAVDPRAFIRPSPTAGTLGGVARRTREALLLCEAAGYDIVVVETVGVGQSETMAHSMVDFFLLLVLPNAGDQLQGIKRGIMEIAHAIVVNKAEEPNRRAAEAARSELEAALHLMRPPIPGWSPAVRLCSALEHSGIGDVWEDVSRYIHHARAEGTFERVRMSQSVAWFDETIQQHLAEHFHAHATVRAKYQEYKRRVAAGAADPIGSAEELLLQYFQAARGED